MKIKNKVTQRFYYAVDKKSNNLKNEELSTQKWGIAVFKTQKERNLWVLKQSNLLAKSITRRELPEYLSSCIGGNMVRCAIPNQNKCIGDFGTPPPYILGIMHRDNVDQVGAIRLNGRQSKERYLKYIASLKGNKKGLSA